MTRLLISRLEFVYECSFYPPFCLTIEDNRSSVLKVSNYRKTFKEKTNV
uniref:Uncharacterized protein n=1 Tax=Candidatus Kentrum sp. LFY TaxID=2126342 RepID=A0A450WDU1_9GAMM|nr:MAG: hypothetical protein BECKLFY1418C_GA0070996_101335 [Candidatus Kentron sp. LFY]